jgi:hypothetical protein
MLMQRVAYAAMLMVTPLMTWYLVQMPLTLGRMGSLSVLVTLATFSRTLIDRVLTQS